LARQLVSDSFFISSANSYLRKTYFPVFTCRSLCFDLLNLVFSLFAFVGLYLAFQHFTRNNCLQILGLRVGIVTWNWFPIFFNLPIDSLVVTFVRLVTWIQICASLNHREKQKA